uniref:Uncharacterized protein n=1 Tax=Amphimedon queenslandica TaxID=400682 RepID=A0A1X7TJC8_AMPQE
MEGPQPLHLIRAGDMEYGAGRKKGGVGEARRRREEKVAAAPGEASGAGIAVGFEKLRRRATGGMVARARLAFEHDRLALRRQSEGRRGSGDPGPDHEKIAFIHGIDPMVARGSLERAWILRALALFGEVFCESRRSRVSLLFRISRLSSLAGIARRPRPRRVYPRGDCRIHPLVSQNDGQARRRSGVRACFPPRMESSVDDPSITDRDRRFSHRLDR